MIGYSRFALLAAATAAASAALNPEHPRYAYVPPPKSKPKTPKMKERQKRRKAQRMARKIQRQHG